MSDHSEAPFTLFQLQRMVYGHLAAALAERVWRAYELVTGKQPSDEASLSYEVAAQMLVRALATDTAPMTDEGPALKSVWFIEGSERREVKADELATLPAGPWIAPTLGAAFTRFLRAAVEGDSPAQHHWQIGGFGSTPAATFDLPLEDGGTLEACYGESWETSGAATFRIVSGDAFARMAVDAFTFTHPPAGSDAEIVRFVDDAIFQPRPLTLH